MKIKAVIEIELDDSWDMDEDWEAEWFDKEVMNGGALTVMDRGEVGDDIGTIKMINWERIDEKSNT